MNKYRSAGSEHLQCQNNLIECNGWEKRQEKFSLLVFFSVFFPPCLSALVLFWCAARRCLLEPDCLNVSVISSTSSSLLLSHLVNASNSFHTIVLLRLSAQPTQQPLTALFKALILSFRSMKEQFPYYHSPNTSKAKFVMEVVQPNQYTCSVSHVSGARFNQPGGKDSDGDITVYFLLVDNCSPSRSQVTTGLGLPKAVQLSVMLPPSLASTYCGGTSIKVGGARKKNAKKD